MNLNFKCKFENLRMFEDEDFPSYIHQVDEVVNEIKGIDRELKENEVVKKVHISLPKSYSLKVSCIEESKDLDKYSMDQLYGALTILQMREFEKYAPKKEATFKVEGGH